MVQFIIIMTSSSFKAFYYIESCRQLYSALLGSWKLLIPRKPNIFFDSYSTNS